MAEETIVFIDIPTDETRGVIEQNVPEGFRLVFANADTDEKSAAVVPQADYVLVWSAYFGTKAVAAATKAKLIQKIGEGTDRLDVALASQMGIPVAKTTGSNSQSVAEYALLLILASMRKLHVAHNGMMAGKWLKWELRSDTYEVHGKRVGIVGLGKIGKKLARLLQGFDAEVVYYDVFRQPEAEEKRLGLTFRELDDLLASSDVVTLHVPSIPATVGMIGRRELGLLKPTATLVNTCRGVVVDEQALIESLREGKIRGAALDAFVKEPLPAGHPFLSLPNVILTPHAGGANEDATLEGVLHAYRNIVKVSRGEPLDPADLVNRPTK